MGSFDNGVGKIELTVELERAGLNCERSRGRARFISLVHDSHSGAELCQPEGQDEAGWASADLIVASSSKPHSPYEAPIRRA